ncbi:MAG: serine/threonine protein kinase [Gammaproteobacteria bacterium]|nr:serine/threonine protein kinase [Gammaproteobacteria bacterium]
MSTDAHRPYQDLLPDLVLDCVEQCGYVTDGRLLELNSYENRVWQVGIEDAEPLVVKFYRAGRWSDAAIAEEHAYTTELAAAGIPVVAPLQIGGETLIHAHSQRLALFPRRGGHAPELNDKAVLTHLGRVLGQWHNIGALRSFHHRGAVDVQSYGHAAVTLLQRDGWIPPHLQENFAAISTELLQLIETVWQRAGAVQNIRLHADCHPGNILWRDEHVHFVDLDDCRMGPALQDLWMLLSGEREEMQQQLHEVLEGYTVFRDFDAAELNLLEPLRSLRMLHFHAWLAQRWEDPAFPRAFPWFDQPRHWEDLLNQLREQIWLLQEAPLQLY